MHIGVIHWSVPPWIFFIQSECVLSYDIYNTSRCFVEHVKPFLFQCGHHTYWVDRISSFICPNQSFHWKQLQPMHDILQQEYLTMKYLPCWYGRLLYYFEVVSSLTLETWYMCTGQICPQITKIRLYSPMFYHFLLFTIAQDALSFD